MRNVINSRLIKVVFDVHYGRFILSLDLTADSLDGTCVGCSLRRKYVYNVLLMQGYNEDKGFPRYCWD